MQKQNRLHYLPSELEIELALAAGPKHIRPEATVYIFGKSGYEKVRYDGYSGGTHTAYIIVPASGATGHAYH